MPKMDLKLRLALRIAALAALCFAASLGYVLLATNQAAHARADRIAELVARDLALQQAQTNWIRNGRGWSADLERSALALEAPGVCIGYRAPDGDVRPRLCDSPAPGDTDAPGFFAAFHRYIFGAGGESVRPVVFGGVANGMAVASVDPRSVIGESWRETRRLGAIMAAVLCGLCLLVYGVLATALRPTRTISAGLERLAAGDLSARLPVFDLAELSAVGRVFNRLASTLEATLAERNALARQVTAVQDEERRTLARELHDEFGQCLAAISAVAASAAQTARQECPPLVAECESIAHTAARMMDALRGALLRLRPPDLDELGLAASLESLVVAWNSRGRGTRFSIVISEPCAPVTRDLADCVYRVAQEAITNAAKHAQASWVRVHLSSEPSRIVLTVDDDGAAEADGSAKSGMGLLGMRERVEAFGGILRAEHRLPQGFALRAEIPVAPIARAAVTEGAA